MGPASQCVRVILLTKRSSPGLYSLDRVVDVFHGALPDDIDARIVELPRESRGIIPRLVNVIFTARLRADVIHVTGDVHYCALAIRRRRCVLTIHDLVSIHRLRGIRRRLFFLLWYRLPVWWSARVTTISSATKNELLTRLPTAAPKISVIPNAVGTEFLHAHRVGRRGATPKVLQVGTGPNKNLERVIRALVEVPVHLRVIGPVDDEQLALLKRSGLSYSTAMNLSGSQMLEEYLESDVLMFASTYEGFGLPIIEAQAVGLPVITAAVTSMPEVAGSGALLVDPCDEGAIRAALLLLLDSPETVASLIIEGHQNVQVYTPPIVANRYAQLYRELIN